MIYRVFHLPEGLRMKLRMKRARDAATTSQIVQAATEKSLPRILESLGEIGFAFDGAATKPTRIPMTVEASSLLKDASKETGIPISRLLFASLHLTCEGEES